MKYRIERWSYNVCTDAVETDSWDIIQDIIKTKKFSEDSDYGECIFEVFADGERVENPVGPEPNEHWYINEENEPQRVGFGDPVEDIENLEELGLLFNTKKETEKAVEKLKALKRLKDKGFEFENWKTWEKVTGHSCLDRNVAHSYYAAFTFRNLDRLEKDEQVKIDLDLLFGEEA